MDPIPNSGTGVKWATHTPNANFFALISKDLFYVDINIVRFQYPFYF